MSKKAGRSVLIMSAVALAVLGAGRAASADYQVPITTVPQVYTLDGQVVQAVDIVPVSPLSAIGVTTMRSAYPFITGAGQTIAIIDTGIDYTHPALASRYLTGYDFADHDSDPMDAYGHGTHVAGIAASTDATFGGVAPGAKIISLKIFSDVGGEASDANIVAALNWVAANATTYNITAVNMSIGDAIESTESTANPAFSPALATLKNMGIFVAAASGNDGYLYGMGSPAADHNAVSVGGTWVSNDWNQYLLWWDDPYNWWGLTCNMGDYAPQQNDIMVVTDRYRTADDGELDLLAPGAIITSSVPLALDDDGTADGWTAMMGTSMAAPQVASASVLVRQALELAGLLDADPARQVDQILGILQSTGTTLNDWYHTLNGGTGNNANAAELPAGSGNWYIRPGSSSELESYKLINLEAAIASINPVPEPTTVLLLTFGAAALLRRRRQA